MKNISLFVLLAFANVVLSELTLNVLHINDFHSRFEPTNSYSGRCPKSDLEDNNCYGGIARLYYAVEDARSRFNNSLFLSAGDNYQGSAWYTVHKWKVVAHFLNLLKLDVMTLGNHEFDDGIEGVIPFLENITFPIVDANIDDSQEPEFQGKVQPSVVIERQGVEIGVIGYTTTSTMESASPGNLKFLDEVDSVKKEAENLRERGIDIIIGLSHAGLDVDEEVAAKVPDIDMIVGGHSHSFLYTGDPPSTEKSVGTYPVVITQDSGKKVPIFQAYAFGKYLGNFEITFDDNGNALQWTGNPILLDGSIPEDQDILEEMEPWQAEVNKLNIPVGKTFVQLDGNRFSCRLRECNLGNLIADAYVHKFLHYPTDNTWSQTSLAVINGGGIRTSFDENTNNGTITLQDVEMILPFENTLDVVKLRGDHVKVMFEEVVQEYDFEGISPNGDFLQVSGFRVAYDLSQPAGSRLITLEAICVECRIPRFEPVEDNKVYTIAIPSFIANGGTINENKIEHNVTELIDSDVVVEYLKVISPVYIGIESRIIFVNQTETCPRSKCEEETETTESNVELNNNDAYETIVEPAGLTSEMEASSGGTWCPSFIMVAGAMICRTLFG